MNNFNQKNKWLAKDAKKERADSSKAEDILWEILKNNIYGYNFSKKHPLEAGIVDFYCHKLKFVIEIDGSDFDTKKIQQLKKEGFYVLKYASSDILNAPGLVELEIGKMIEKIENMS